MNLPMKIKRTLPSISLYSPIAKQKVLVNRNTQHSQIPKNPQPFNNELKNKKQNIQRYQKSSSQINHSPSRIPIFQSPNKLSMGNQNIKQNRSSQKIKKSVTFSKDNSIKFNDQQKNINFNSKNLNKQYSYATNSPQRNTSPGRNYKRKNIFQKSVKNASAKKQPPHILNHDQNIQKHIIPVLLNVKQFSDRLKKIQQQKDRVHIDNNTENVSINKKIIQSQPQASIVHPNKKPYIQENSINQSQLLKKIDHIEHIIENIQQKIVQKSNQKQKQQTYALKQANRYRNGHFEIQTYKQKYRQKQFERPPDTKPGLSKTQIQNNLLKLQLEQMRRCERIAKQNQILYGKLVKDIQKNEYQIKSSRKSSRSNKQFMKSNNTIFKQRYTYQYKSVQPNGPNITAFEDFVEARQLSQNKYTEQNIQITSPFQVPQNKTKYYGF